ncbi:MAG TPA: diguanylate cyclase [Rhodanobacter sp.]|nr:diguanylate cyclase [Rhodanobacter sp.]
MFALLYLFAATASAGELSTHDSSATSWAPWQTISFDQVNVDKGLPHATTTALAQDRDGLIWIGTVGGLVRYDGYRAQVFRQSVDATGSIPDNYVRALQAADDNSIIVGTTSGGLARFDPRTNRFTYYDKSPGHGTGSRIFALAPDRAGGFWVAGQEGLSHLLADLRTIERPAAPADAQLPADAPILSVLQDRQGNLWVGSSKGLYLQKSGSTGFRRYHADDSNAAIAFAKDIWAIYQDRAGNIWVGSGADGVAIIDGQGRATVPRLLDGDSSFIQHRTVRAILERPDGRVWIATDGVGVVIFDPQNATATSLHHDSARASSLGGNIVRALLMDRSDGLWVATESGASRYDTYPSMVYSLDATALFGNQATGENVRSIYTDRDGNVWLGFSRGRVAMIDLKHGVTHTLVLEGAQSDQDVRAISQLEDGRIVVGSRGLLAIDPATRQMKPYLVAGLDAKPILAVSPYRGGLLVGTYDGLYRLDKSGRLKVFRHDPGNPHSLADNQVRNIVHMDNGETWIATVNGISILHGDEQTFDNLRNVTGDHSSLPQNYTGSVVTVGSTIWVATYGGLAFTSATPGASGYRFTTMTAKGGQGSDNVASVLADRHGRLWSATTSGLEVFDPATRQTLTVGLRDGLGVRFYNQRTAALGPSGELLFGGLGGLTVVEPDRSATATRPTAPLAITAMAVNETPVPFARLPRPGHPLHTGDNTHSLLLRFALLDYTATANIHYSYRLQGFDDDWIAVDAGARPETKYTNLPGGHYELWLRAQIPGLQPRTVETHVPIVIGPRWHERTVTRLGALCLLLAAIYGLVRVRTRYLHRRTDELSRQVSERTAELQAANQRLEQLASTDDLTGLLNRRELMHQLDLEYAACAGGTQPLSVLMLDLDEFKQLNDHFGHLAGDVVLRDMAAVITECSRDTDHVGRYGGEEIMLVLPRTDDATALLIAERICGAVARATYAFGGNLLHSTISIGVATLRHGEQPQALVARADAALYRAKRAGRNTVMFEPAEPA